MISIRARKYDFEQLDDEDATYLMNLLDKENAIIETPRA
jgi:hypothetical protein